MVTRLLPGGVRAETPGSGPTVPERGGLAGMRPSAASRAQSAWACLPLALALLVGCATEPALGRPPTVEGLPAVRPVAPDSRVGAVFPGEGDLHLCTASVLASESANLILTAAHCLAADDDTRFVPGFGGDAAGAGEDDTWHVDAVYLDPRWLADQDPVADFAVARVERADGARLESVTGEGLRLGAAPRPGDDVTVIGYPAGVGGGPSACRAAAASHHGYPALHCDGVVGGFSGAPWISGSTVSGLIGGLDGGGCLDEISYSPPFGTALTDLLTRAQTGAPADRPPEDFTDGCE
ncbi:trypsin-like peptidase domain-containing protein [Mycolicibacterium sp. BiH015]|uniref:trypsin-like serine peptidase n=1 Tax=Mycolicibacterium sp. BiH015 TaxID=3018808 RepID=UPI0022E336C3|nr:serine protease [Mycolicibacterium sp. BiH015]MDA2891325.1 trypsin-like peptidase domain-containing protein [Mycolicibacterium sp. BiH015]